MLMCEACYSNVVIRSQKMDLLQLQLPTPDFFLHLTIHIPMKVALANNLKLFFMFPLSQNHRNTTSKQDPDLVSFSCPAWHHTNMCLICNHKPSRHPLSSVSEPGEKPSFVGHDIHQIYLRRALQRLRRFADLLKRVGSDVKHAVTFVPVEKLRMDSGRSFHCSEAKRLELLVRVPWR